MTEAMRLRLDRVRLVALWAAVICGALCVAGLIADHRTFFQSYLLGVIFWLGASLGCAAFLMIYNLTGGRWGDHVAGIFQSGMAPLPVMTALFIPVLLGIGSLYKWSHPELVRIDPNLMHKTAWLNVPRFVGGTVLYFVVWLLGAFFLVRWGDLYRRTGEGIYGHRLARLSGGGLVAYVLTMSFAGFDWLMSLEPHWYSTVYGVIVIAGQGLLAIAITTITYILLNSEGELGRQTQRGILYDLGNFLLMTVAFWAYVQFSQLLVIYYGNVPEEVKWYMPRMRSGWGMVGVAIIALHFAAPLALLLSRTLKQQARGLFPIACGLIVMQYIAEMWVTMPAFEARPGWAAGLDVAAVAAIGGVWVAVFVTQLKRRPMWAIAPPSTASHEMGHIEPRASHG